MSSIKSTRISLIPKKFTGFSMERIRSAKEQTPEKSVVIREGRAGEESAVESVQASFVVLPLFTHLPSVEWPLSRKHSWR